MPCWRDDRRTWLGECRGSFMRRPALRWKAWCARGSGGRARRPSLHYKNIGRPIGPPFLHLLDSLVLQHLYAVNVDLGAVNVSGHGNVMSIVLLQGIGIIHGQDLLVSVGNDNRAGALFDALLCAFF